MGTLVTLEPCDRVHAIVICDAFALPSPALSCCHPRLDRGSPYTELIADTIPITLSPRIKVGEPAEPFRGRLIRF